MKIPVSLVLLSAAVLLTGGAPQSTEADAAVATLNALDARVLTIGTRLAIAGQPICANSGHASGFTVQTASQYSAAYRPAAAKLLGIGDRPTITAVSAQSASARAGVRARDQIVAVDGVRLASSGARTGDGDFDAADAAMRAVDRGQEDGALELELLRDGAPLRIVVATDRACRARFDVRAGAAMNANANGTYVQISSKLVQSLGHDQDLAAIIAHEMAHNILGHDKVLERTAGGLLAGFGRSGRTMRATELAADRLSVYLLALGGYPIGETAGFWASFAGRSDYGPFSDGTHPGAKQRVAAIQQEVARITAMRARGEPVRPPASLLSSSTGTSGDRPPAPPR